MRRPQDGGARRGGTGLFRHALPCRVWEGARAGLACVIGATL
ncbi:hypothetical protein [Xanthomonas perforans]|nr:hypothetical protein [Xanthomonas perforans]